MYLKIIILNEISLTKKSTCYTIQFILNSRNYNLTYSDGADGGLPGEWGWVACRGAGGRGVTKGQEDTWRWWVSTASQLQYWFYSVYVSVTTYHTICLRCLRLTVCPAYLCKAIQSILGLYLLEILEELLFLSPNINYTLRKTLELYF